MFTIIRNMHVQFTRPAGGVIALLFFILFAEPTFAQNTAALRDDTNQTAVEKPAATTPQPVASIYKEVKIGAGADEVRRILGKAKIDDKDGFFYDLESEMVQIRLDDDKKVRLIAVTYTSESPNAPKFTDIFGTQPFEAKPDGSVYKLVRYPESGYWIAYSKTAGEKPSITVTMQKL